MSEPQFGDVDYVAKKYGTPRSWWYGTNHKKGFPPGVAVKIGAYLRFDLAKLDEWIRSGEAAR